jgi:hypothetical protein
MSAALYPVRMRSGQKNERARGYENENCRSDETGLILRSVAVRLCANESFGWVGEGIDHVANVRECVCAVGGERLFCG